MTETVYIGLGSNLGERQTNLHRAIDQMNKLDRFELMASSSVYQTEPMNMQPDTPLFYNQVVRAVYGYSPPDLLRELETIERSFGRTGKGDYKSRTLDLDILLFGGQIIDTLTLTIPHPRLLERPFMLVPLLELNPLLTDPINGRHLSEYVTSHQRLKTVPLEEHVTR